MSDFSGLPPAAEKTILQSQLTAAQERERELTAASQAHQRLLSEAADTMSHQDKHIAALEAVVSAARLIDQQAPLDHEHRELRTALDALEKETP